MIESNTVLARVTLKIATVAKSAGADVDTYLAEVGLTWDDLEEPDARIPAKKHIGLGQRVAAELGEAALGMAVGSSLSADDMGMAGYILRNCDSLGDFIRHIDRYFPLITGEIVIELHDEVGELGVVFRPPPGITELAAPSVGIITTIVRTLNMHLEQPVMPRRVEVISRREELPEEFFEFIECVVVDDANRIAVIWDAAHADIAIVDADPALKRHLAAYADKIMPKSVPGYASQVRASVQASLDTGPTIEEIASDLAVSKRTLQRRLAAEHTNFATLLDEVRRERAVALLHDGSRTIAEVAYAVGYADAATFSNRFKMWTGSSPSDYRGD